MTTQTSQRMVEWNVQVLVEMEDGTVVGGFTREYVEGAIGKIFASARDIRAIITIADEDDQVVVQKFNNNPTQELRERAWK